MYSTNIKSQPTGGEVVQGCFHGSGLPANIQCPYTICNQQSSTVQQDDLAKFTSVIGGRISNDNADGNFLKYSSSAEYVRRVSQSDHGNVLSQRGGVSQYTREAYVH